MSVPDFFRKLDLRSLFYLRDVPGIQETLGIILWRLDSVACNYTPVRGLAEQVLLLGVHAQLRATFVSEYDTEEWILAGYLLNPLFDFGLIEKQAPGELPGIGTEDSIRLSSLWRRFLVFGDPG